EEWVVAEPVDDRLNPRFRLNRIRRELFLGETTSSDRPQDAVVGGVLSRGKPQLLAYHAGQRFASERGSLFRQRLRFRLREYEQRLRIQLRYLPLRRALQRLILFQDQLRLALRIGNAGDAVKPAVHPFTVFLREAVIARTDIESDIVGCP